jgi:hypothetical protein
VECSQAWREFVGQAWAAQEVALGAVTSVSAEHVHRHVVLDAFGGDGETQIVGEFDRRADDYRVVFVLVAIGEAGDERFVDFDLVDW